MRSIPDVNEYTVAEIASQLVDLCIAIVCVGGDDDPQLSRYVEAKGLVTTPTLLPQTLDREKIDDDHEKQRQIQGRPSAWEELSRELLPAQVYDMLDRAMHITGEYGDLISSNVEWFNGILMNAIRIVSPPQVPPKVRSIVRGLAWHPYRQLLAVAQDDDVVYFYDLKSESWSEQVLIHPMQHDIRCLEWSRHHTDKLAVGCRDGVCLWEVKLVSKTDSAPKEFSDVIATRFNIRQPQILAATVVNSAWCQFLVFPNHTDISTLSWDPTTGSNLLASGSVTGNAIVVWDTLLGSSTAIRRPGKGISVIQWSPDGSLLFTAYTSGTVRIWNTRTWQPAIYHIHKSQIVQSACWTRDSKAILYCLENGSTIYTMQLVSTMREVAWKQGTLHSFPSQPELCRLPSGKSTLLGGPIQNIVIDEDTGERMVVQFEHSELLAVLLLKSDTSDASPDEWGLLNGFIRGPSWPANASKGDQEPRPCLAAFCHGYRAGSILSIAWEEGSINFVPFYFEK
ncbi:hypothetical protein BZG36_00913 [Bifiguratus adelaidae]|uniref:Anaphase-promoting complex subunit 4-like WD40 domain-containing protein n=1 Tax=Bifiguratus adelaidae TaxID=1938954 RepID=A0A261Y5J3_9FUNG|nr:hypothetical protein BZG36_00913 [Bifiguratus adelaidae]